MKSSDSALNFDEKRMAMSSVLQKIVEHKKRELKQLMKERPMDVLKSQIKCERRRPRGFRKALEKKRTPLPVIAELKKKSPSRGVMKKRFLVKDIAKSYEANGASALSVLTDQRYFEGQLQHIKIARNATRIPILRKDFILEPYQVYESFLAGADAVLLIAYILTKKQLLSLKSLCDQLVMDALIEVHNDDDLLKISTLKDALIGINNRDLDTFHVNLRTTARLAPRLSKHHFVVSESGIHHHQDLLFLKSLGVRAVLVGQSLMQSPDPGKALRSLLVSPH